MAELVQLTATDTILDLGCGVGGKSVASYNSVNEIVGLDRFPPERSNERGQNFRYVQGDARDLSTFEDRSFDVVLSIGLLEHIAVDGDLRSVLSEAKRVGHRYAHVVPHRWGFLEPHFRLPFFALWPAPLKDIGVRVVGRRGRAAARWKTMRWPSRRQWLELLRDPNARVVDHWYGPLLMYFILVGGERVNDASAS